MTTVPYLLQYMCNTLAMTTVLPGPAAGLQEVEHGLLPHLEALGVHEIAVGAGTVVTHHLQQARQL